MVRRCLADDARLRDGVSNHLPECPCAKQPDMSNHWHEHGAACTGCICTELRACEQRVRQESSTPSYLCVACWHRQDGHACERPQNCTCRDCNYSAALDAAEAAVANIQGPLYSVRNSGNAQQGWDAHNRHALAAIRALKEKPMSDGPSVPDSLAVSQERTENGTGLAAVDTPQQD